MEDIRLITPQRIFTPVRSHDGRGNRMLPLLPAGVTMQNLPLQIAGYADIEIFNLSDVLGKVYIYLGVDPARLTTVVPGVNASAMFNYDIVNVSASYRYPCRSEYVVILYANDPLHEQTVWEFSVQFKPIGRN